MSADSTWSISFCTTCRNRLPHLSETLPPNLAALSSATIPTEFLLLDYGSSDGLEDWVKAECWDSVEAGKLQVFRTDEPEHYDSSHAKNVVHRLGRCRLLCNLDADNFITEGFIDDIVRRFSEQDNVVLFGHRGSRGRVVIRRDDFLSLGGYDEDFIGWGHDDVDLTRRAAAALNRVEIRMEGFDRYINHGNRLRTCQMRFQNLSQTRESNRQRSLANVAAGKLVANTGRPWGAARLCINYDRNYWFDSVQEPQ